MIKEIKGKDFRKMQLTELDMLVEFDKVCRKYNINYVQQSDFTIHSTAERLDQILKLDESCDYFYKIRIPQQIRKQLLAQLDAMGFHESSIYPDMEHIAKEQADSHFNF